MSDINQVEGPINLIDTGQLGEGLDQHAALIPNQNFLFMRASLQ